MSLEFNKLLQQVEKMGEMVSQFDFDINDKLDIAVERFARADDMEDIWRKIEYVRGADISGYRGAAPLDAPYTEPVNYIYPEPAAPEYGTLLASDGSQIYLNEQSPVHYYLLNLGLFIYQYGVEVVPTTITTPTLVFQKELVHDDKRQVVNNTTVNARRTVAEIQFLAQQAWRLHREGTRDPLVTLFDNNLSFWTGADVTGGDQLMRDFHIGMGQLRDADAILGGYVDSPSRSRTVLRLLYLTTLGDEEHVKAHEAQLAAGGDLEGLRDAHLFNRILERGERSALMVQNSPRNLSYKQQDRDFEIAFFYVKVYNGYQTAIARVDLPMWVARDEASVNHLHGMVLDQCRIQGRTPYPYALTRADELAVVSNKDKRKLDEMIRMELQKLGIQPNTLPPKAQSKIAARSSKRAYQIAPTRMDRR